MKRFKEWLIFWTIVNITLTLFWFYVGILKGKEAGSWIVGGYFWLYAVIFLVCSIFCIVQLVRHNYVEREATYEIYREDVDREKERLRTMYSKKNDINKKFIYVCSPYSGDVEKNVQNTLIYCRNIYKAGHIPIAPHLYFTRFLDDTYTDERRDGIEMGLNLLRFCDELWVFGGHISDGMRQEIAFANAHGIPVKEI